MSEVWLKSETVPTRFGIRNLLNIANVADQSGEIAIDVLWPGLVPMEAKSLILTVERGFNTAPPGGTGAVTFTVMANGYNNTNVLDRAKTQEWMIDNMGVDVIALDVRMPIDACNRSFFWAMHSTCPTVANKMAIIDLWGWTL
jgi:hypothetical protein